jgi:mannose/fructose/N-acetylgalactosamine-specific phosphotransferase system component IID
MKMLITLFKSLFYHAGLNHENMQGTGFYYLLKDASKRNGVEIEPEVLENQRKYFQTHPFLVNFILGMWLTEYKKGTDPETYKKAYSSAFGALGDSFFGHSLRPFAFVFAAITATVHPFLGVLVYLAVYNIFHLSFLFSGLSIGISMGREVIVWFNRIRFNKWPEYFDLVSVFFLGFFISYMFKTEVTVTADDFFIAVAYLFMGLTLAKKMDITLGLMINLILSGIIFFQLGV